MIPCSYWALTCCAALPSCKTLYVISVRQTRDLPVVSLFPHPASFRFHLTMDTLAFGYILPTTRRIRDLHPLETCAAGRTLKNGVYNPYYKSYTPFSETSEHYSILPILLLFPRCLPLYLCCLPYPDSGLLLRRRHHPLTCFS